MRTLSSAEAGFNPIGYHVGTIWPHDNAIIAVGMARMGFREESNRIALAMIDAALVSRWRLPEAFAGFPRGVSSSPSRSRRPAARRRGRRRRPFFLLNAMLGLSIQGGELAIDPRIPKEIGHVHVRGIHAFGGRWDVEAEGDSGEVRVSDAT